MWQPPPIQRSSVVRSLLLVVVHSSSSLAAISCKVPSSTMHAQEDLLMMRPDLIIRPELIAPNEHEEDLFPESIDPVILQAMINTLEQTCMRGFACDGDSYGAAENSMLDWLGDSSLQEYLGPESAGSALQQAGLVFNNIEPHMTQMQWDVAFDPEVYDQQSAQIMVGDQIFHPQLVSSSSNEFSGADSPAGYSMFDMGSEQLFASPVSAPRFSCKDAHSTSGITMNDHCRAAQNKMESSPTSHLDQCNVDHSSLGVLPASLEGEASFYKATTAGTPASYDSHAHYLGFGEQTSRSASTHHSGKRKRETMLTNPETTCDSTQPQQKHTCNSSEDASVSERKPRRTGTKRTRAPETHNKAERTRRSLINERLRALQEVIPNANKTDKASLLTEAINYLVKLRLHLQLLNQVIAYKNASQRVQQLSTAQAKAAAMGSMLYDEPNFRGSSTTDNASPCVLNSLRAVAGMINGAPMHSAVAGAEMYAQGCSISTKSSQFPLLPISTPSCPKGSTEKRRNR